MSDVRDNEIVTPPAGRSAATKRLHHAWGRQRRFVHTRGFYRALLTAAALMAVSFLMDWGLKLPGRPRAILLVINMLVLAGAGYFGWLRYLRSYDPVRVALQVEGLYPQLQSLLVSYVQLRAGGPAMHGMSAALVAAMGRQAEEQIRPLDFGKIVRFRTLWLAAVYSVAVVLVIAGAALWQPTVLGIFARRILNPVSAATYPTRTLITSVSGDLTVREGRTVVLRATAGGEVPERGLLVILQADAEPETVRLTGVSATTAGATTTGATTTAARQFSYRIDEAYRSFTYWFRLGDAESRECRVRVIPPPQVDVRLTVTYPPYINRTPKETGVLGLELVKGSRIDWYVKSDRPLAAAELVRDKDKPMSMNLAADGRSGTMFMVPGKSFSYGFRWRDKEHRYVYAPAIRYGIQIVPDRRPTVTLLTPTRDEKATARKELDIAFTARDDYGLKTARIVYAIQRPPATKPGDEEVKEIQAFARQPRQARAALRWSVGEAIADLRPGDVVHYAVEVLDNRDGPAAAGAGRSQTRRLTVVSAEEYLRMVMERRKQLVEKIKALHGEEQQAGEEVSKLKKDKTDAPKRERGQ